LKYVNKFNPSDQFTTIVNKVFAANKCASQSHTLLYNQAPNGLASGQVFLYPLSKKC